VVVKGPSLLSRVFGTTQRLAADILQIALLLYFLLAAGDLFLQKLVKVLPNVEDKQAAVVVARKIESSISTYLLTAAAINIAEGILVGIMLWLLGMPNPMLWAVLVTAMEFIPYIGAVITTGVLTLAALTVFDGVGQALLVPGVYVLTNILQGNVIAPLLFGQRLTLNPVAIFVGFAFWWYVWGVPGAFISVPLLAAFKILCDHVGALASVGEFLGQRDVHERRATIRDGETATV
jgi:predicted PurR-regulated permease PerM